MRGAPTVPTVSMGPASDRYRTEVLRLHVRDGGLVPACGEAARVAGRHLGLAGERADELGAAVAGVAGALVGAAFDDPADVDLVLHLVRGPASLVARVQHRGLPFVSTDEGVHQALDHALGHRGAQRVRLEHPDEGGAVEIEVGLPAEAAGPLGRDDPGSEALAADEPAELDVRPLQRDDAAGLARCAWRVYGYSYQVPLLYHPDEVWAQVEAGRLRSVVAVDAAGEVVGHAAVLVEGPGAVMGDFGLALTDPRYRRHRVLDQIAVRLLDEVADLGLLGTFTEAVAFHPITQRAVVAAGGVETGLLLSTLPATVQLRGFADDVQRARQSLVLSFTAPGPLPARRVHLPPAYADELGRKHAEAELDRTVVPAAETARAAAAASGRSRVRVELRAVLGKLVVDRAGPDLVEVLDHHRRAVCAGGRAVVFVELRLDDPVAVAAVEGLRDRGFFYAGFIPELRDGDVLRLQYVEAEVDTSVIRLATDEAKRILDLTLADRG